MTDQNTLRLLMRPGKMDHSKTVFPHTQRQFNQYEQPFETSCKADKLLADTLNRHASQIMVDVTNCPADTIPAHLARLDATLEVLRLAIRHSLLPPDHCRVSGAQLCNPVTCADFVEALVITRKQHRAPCAASLPSPQLDRMESKLETIANYLAEVANA